MLTFLSKREKNYVNNKSEEYGTYIITTALAMNLKLCMNGAFLSLVCVDTKILMSDLHNFHQNRPFPPKET